ncbi:hypothetical protein OXX80_004932, partial [Metschnikowia pulcherrima]
RAFLDAGKPVGTHYGAILGLEKLGPEVVKLVLVANLKVWYKSVVVDGEKSPLERELLTEKVLGALRKLHVPKQSDAMDVASVPEDLRQKLADRIGAPLTEVVLASPDAGAIAEGIFFGEVGV